MCRNTEECSHWTECGICSFTLYLYNSVKPQVEKAGLKQLFYAQSEQCCHLELHYPWHREI